MIFVREEGGGREQGERETERELCGMLEWGQIIDCLERKTDIGKQSPDICPILWTMESFFLEFSNLEGQVKSHVSKRLN